MPNCFPVQITLTLVLLTAVTGCRLFDPSITAPAGPESQTLPNPLAVPMLDRALVMDEVSDELDNYFRIFKEERIRIVDSVMTEGWIETHPRIGGSVLEPWNRDSTAGFERWHSTLQTIRRFAKVRVIPTAGNYQIDVRVYKELEDLAQPLNSSVRGLQSRYDNSLDADNIPIIVPQKNLGWIPLGRDLSLEQQILRNVQARLSEIQQDIQ